MIEIDPDDLPSSGESWWPEAMLKAASYTRDDSDKKLDHAWVKKEKARLRKFYLEHKAEIHEQGRKRHADKMATDPVYQRQQREKARRWRQAHGKEYYEKNKERILAKQRARYAAKKVKKSL